MKYKRQLAMAGIVLLLLLYVFSILFALSDSPLAGSLLTASVYCTIVVPVMLYGYYIIVKYMRNRKR